MNNGKERILWMVYAGVLIILFILSSTDWIIKEREKEIYSISLIIEAERDDNYVNFRKGVDRAAVEMNADVSFFTLYNSGNTRQQMDFILREQQDGAQALIVVPASEPELAEALSDGRIQRPVVLVNSDLSGGKAAAAITPDYFQMGERLAGEVIGEQKTPKPVMLFSGAEKNKVTDAFRAGIVSVLESEGWQYEEVSGKETKDFLEVIEARISSGTRDLVLIALDQETLAGTAAMLSEHWIHANYISGLYGRGSTIGILNYLDKEIITGVCMFDDFSAGYLSVKMAVDAAANQIYHGPVRLDSYYIRKPDLKNPEYEKKLYPIE